MSQIDRNRGETIEKMRQAVYAPTGKPIPGVFLGTLNNTMPKLFKKLCIKLKEARNG